jgi:CRISPR-associated protein Csm4
MNTYIFKLKFKGPVHFGDTGIDLENVQPTISSDTLFSALVNALSANLGNQEADKFISDFQQKPPFLVSSLFPYVGNVYYLPKPLDDSFIDKDVKRKAGKELKKTYMA